MQVKKKLYKDSSTGKLAGVLSGIAQYFGYDVTTVRVLYALACILIFRIVPGILIYLVLAFIMPDKKDIGFDDYEIH